MRAETSTEAGSAGGGTGKFQPGDKAMLINGTIRYEVEVVQESIQAAEPAPAKKLPPGARRAKPAAVPTPGYLFRYVKCAAPRPTPALAALALPPAR